MLRRLTTVTWRQRETLMTTLLPEVSGNGRTSHAHESDGPGLGALLRRAREGRGLTLEQISNETRIPRRHLAALEHDNLAVVPGGFYRRAEIRAYARAVNLDQNVALAELDRAEAGVPKVPGRRAQAPSGKRVLIVIGVVVAAAVLGRAMAGREPAIQGDAQPRSTSDSPHSSVPPIGEMPADAIVETPQRTPSGQIAPASVTSDGAPEKAMEPTATRASMTSKSDLAVTTDPAAARASPDSVTELVVTTEPVGARVTVNGIGWGVAPVTIRYLPAGDKRIRVSKEGYVTEERIVRLAEGHPKVLDIRLNSAQ